MRASTFSARARRLRALLVAGSGLIAGPTLAQTAAEGGFTPAAPVGGALPSYGTGPAVGDLRPQLERYFQQSLLPSTAPAFVIQPAIGVDVGVTDNANRLNTGKKADVFTLITPSVLVTQDSARIKSTLSYAPSIQVYASTSSQNQIAQYFAGQSLATLYRDALFLDLRGSITQSSQVGSGFSNGNVGSYNRQNQVQTINFAVTPYAEHRFGGWGTARIGYSLSRTIQDQATGFGGGSDVTTDSFGNPINGNGYGYGRLGNLTTQRERASFSTGENLGRFNNQTILEAIQYGGSGYSGSHRNQVLDELGYAVTRRVTLLGGIGYQDILYTGNRTSGSNAVRVNEPTWNVGTRYSPNPDSTITVLYGRRDGSTSVTLNGDFSPSARSRIFARYSTGITSDLEDAQNLLATTSVGPTGLVTDAVTGAPVSGGSIFGIQNGVYRVRRATVNGLLLAARDSYSLTFGVEDRTTLTSTTSYYTGNTVPSGTSSSSYYVTGVWQHELAPDMSSSLSLQYGSTNNTSQLLGLGNQRQDTISVAAAVTKQFTPTLTGSVRYIHNDRFGGNNFQTGQTYSNNYSENILLVGLRKGF